MVSGRRLVVASLLSLVVAGCGGGGGPGGSGATSVVIKSLACSQTSATTITGFGKVLAKGTAGGPVGSQFKFAIANGGETGVTFDCGGWSLGQQGGANNTSCKNVSGPSTISWTVTQDVDWCLTNCNPSGANNNVDDPKKFTYADIYDPNNNKTETTKNVTCP